MPTISTMSASSLASPVVDPFAEEIAVLSVESAATVHCSVSSGEVDSAFVGEGVTVTDLYISTVQRRSG